MSSVRRNRAWWNGHSADYQHEHEVQLSAIPKAWGVWAIPDSELGVFGNVAGLDILEFGCGGARWAMALRAAGARCVGMDLSDAQLAHARRTARAHNLEQALVQAAGEEVPFADDSFDIVFCDHGAMTFAPPARTVPEVSRVLRPGGLLAFNVASPLLEVAWDPENDRLGTTLNGNYFELGAVDEGGAVSYQLPHGEWIRLFRRHGLTVEDLIEIRPPENADTTYNTFAPLEWARKWPAENLWKVRKEGAR